MLINTLQESDTKDPAKSYLHENCIQRLNKTAPTHLNVFTVSYFLLNVMHFKDFIIILLSNNLQHGLEHNENES